MLTCPDCGGVVELGLVWHTNTDATPYAYCTEGITCGNTWNQWGEEE